MDSGTEHWFSAKFACPVCGYSLPELEPRLFSFNNPMGACPKCDGLGKSAFRSGTRGRFSASGRWLRARSRAGTSATSLFQMLEALASIMASTLDTPFESCRKNAKVILHGSGKEIRFPYLNESAAPNSTAAIRSRHHPQLERRYRKPIPARCAKNWRNTRTASPCPSCGGSRLRREGALRAGGGKACTK